MRLFLLFLVGCQCPDPVLQGPSTLTVSNNSQVDTTVYVAFGADSQVLPVDWSFCQSPSDLNCNFPLMKQSAQNLPLSGNYLNATISFFQPVTCGTTKAEVNLNNPNWYDIGDISLVDGFNVPVKMYFAGQTIGPVVKASGNETAAGVYPNGCDICVARENPPCGLNPGSDGCKAGTQYDPAVPCQLQGTIKGGGQNNVLVELLDLEPA